MTIAVICDVLGKENNGTTIAAMNLIRSLREKGYDVRVVCSDPERAGQKDFYVVPILNLGPLNASQKRRRAGESGQEHPDSGAQRSGSCPCHDALRAWLRRG